MNNNYIFNNSKLFLQKIEENLKNAKKYCFASAYFDLKSFMQYHKSLKSFMNKSDSQAIFLVSSKVDKETYNLIRAGEMKEKEIFTNIATEKILNTELIEDIFAWISSGKLEIKFSITSKPGIFHIKQGYIQKENNDWISWSGSLNHTTAALVNNNVEQINFFNSSDNSEHGVQNITIFDQIYNNEIDEILTYNANDLLVEELFKHSKIEDQQSLSVLKESFLLNKYDFILDTIDNQSLFARSKIKISPYLHLPEVSYIKNNDTEYTFDTKGDITAISKYVSNNDSWYVTSAAKMLLSKSINNIKYKLKCGKTIKNEWMDLTDSTRNLTMTEQFVNFCSAASTGMVRTPQKLQFLQAFYSFKMYKSMNFSVPGTGKTMTVLTAFNAWKQNHKTNRIIVVAPTSAFQPWVDEWKETFGFEPKTLFLSSINGVDSKYQNIVDMNYENYDLVIMHFATAAKYNKEIIRSLLTTDLFVIDEAHYIKNFQGNWGRSITNIVESSGKSICLTGTPAPNGPQDINNLIKMTYGEEYLNFIIQFDNLENAISPLFVRVDYDDLNMPWKQNISFVNFNLNQKQIEKEEELTQKYKEENEYGYLHYYINMMQLYTSEKSITINLDLERDIEFNSSTVQTASSPKLEKLVEIINNNKDKNIVIWSVFINSMKSIANALKSMGINVYVYNGQKTDEERIEIINQYKENGGILIANAKTLAESVSLHKHTDLSIYFEYTLSLSELLQSMNRTYRYGNTKDAEYIFLQSNNSNQFDKKMYDLLMQKKETQNDIIKLKTVSDQSFSTLKNQIKKFIRSL